MSHGGKVDGQEIFPVGRLVSGPLPLYVKRSGWLRRSYGFHYAKFNREYNMHFVHSGRGCVLVDGVEHEMKAGDVFLFFPGHRTEHYDFSGERWEYHWVALGCTEGMGDALDGVMASSGFSESAPSMRLPRSSGLWSFVPKLHNRFQAGDYGGIFPVSAAWRILEGLASGKDVCAIPLAERVRNYVDGLDGAAEVKELTERFGVSRSTLHRVFSEAFGESLKGYMQRLRFSRACELLSSPGMDVRQVAFASGFSSVQYFCRAFKGNFGSSPGVWRRTNS